MILFKLQGRPANVSASDPSRTANPDMKTLAVFFAVMLLKGAAGDAGYNYPGPLNFGPRAPAAPRPAPQPNYVSASSGDSGYLQAQGSGPGVASLALEPSFGPLTANLGIQSQPAVSFASDRAPEVHKHIYVHVPPPEAPQPLPPLVLPPPQKHYKIIFVKVPSPPAHPRPVMQQLLQKPQIEEKTIVYVLVSKPEPDPFGPSLAALPPPQPSKPEVYFIKYGTQKSSSSPQLAPGPGPLEALGSSDSVAALGGPGASLGDYSSASSSGALHAAYGPPPVGSY